MPELPEVETTRRGIEPYLSGKCLVEFKVRQPRLRWPIEADIAQRIEGQRVEGVGRRGKYLLVKFSEGALLIHLGMSGSMRVLPAMQDPGKHDHVDLLMEDGTLLRYSDPRRFGSMLWSDYPLEKHKLLASLGPEPLDEHFDVEYLYQRTRQRQVPIKTLIMDSHVVVGVGNIYANESLFMSGIDPRRKSGRISKKRIGRLVENIKQVLDEAIKQGGTTLKDFVGGDGRPGYFKQQLQVYGRGGEPCTECHSSLHEIKIAQRSTVFCPRCQR